jgi:hypothetical protein
MPSTAALRASDLCFGEVKIPDSKLPAAEMAYVSEEFEYGLYGSKNQWLYSTNWCAKIAPYPDLSSHLLNRLLYWLRSSWKWQLPESRNVQLYDQKSRKPRDRAIPVGRQIALSADGKWIATTGSENNQLLIFWSVTDSWRLWRTFLSGIGLFMFLWVIQRKLRRNAFRNPTP